MRLCCKDKIIDKLVQDDANLLLFLLNVQELQGEGQVVIGVGLLERRNREEKLC